MAAPTPYIGSKISLVSKLDIRYEGILYTVDTQESTIALAKVKSFGTEDRPTANPVSARDEIYEYIIFKASDIKDLIVCETPKQPTQSEGLYSDPAILHVSRESECPPQQQRPPSTESGDSNKRESKAQLAAKETAKPRQPKKEPYLKKEGEGSAKAPGTRGDYVQRGGSSRGGNNVNGRGGYRGNSFVTRGGRVSTGFGRDKLKFDSDYDFVKANEQFQESLSHVISDFRNVGVQDIEKPDESYSDSGDSNHKEDGDEKDACYNRQSSFFDNISCDALEKAEGRSNRPDWRKERITNQETFGHTAVRALNFRSRGGRGPYRGNRGGPPSANYRGTSNSEARPHRGRFQSTGDGRGLYHSSHKRYDDKQSNVPRNPVESK
uniref:FFD domain-containing protein n=1 Tax=Rhabditophanes sp. KR3021 TaxID=114890 RepID=A0AC35TFK7_9BILA